ncbi:DNA topoisomerase I [Legionella geestiana]|uniref:DNA topoisomerase n=1 Tax=Legionella geestiana TaxID=45065 RepID=A0A0W0U6J8_9GAMM|nr:DNA topoisomerase 3 [Legionella geestiana]KTD03694.1 DNA topoisomerase I [Legionella geestiana]QBS11534.1 DNA topoisomerase III [Legionella geestiana]STX53796.1 DNA topoisomerase [Legionella geestiana]
MRLFIAEKPSVARAIATELGISGKEEGALHCGRDKITWCFGHMLALAEPDAYTGNKRWSMDELPIIPEQWIITPKVDAKKQLRVIERLLEEATTVVNAGDADREGQLLVDEILTHFNCKKPVLRFWVAAHDAVSLQRGLANLKDNAQYQGLGRAALARSRADWLIGMNLSRAYTLKARQSGVPSLVTVGRVQTPTLKLVVERDREIAAFVAMPFYGLKATMAHQGTTFIATFKPAEDMPGLDSEGRLIDKALADRLAARIQGRTGAVVRYQKAPKSRMPPLPYTLSDITLEASSRYGLGASEVLAICQTLYEIHKLTSYPRTDCSYLPESQFADVPDILHALKAVNPDMLALIEGASPAIRSRAWDDAKVSVHFGIIPTRQEGSKAALSGPERQVYELIVRRYLAQFYPPEQYLVTDIDIAVEEAVFTLQGRTVLEPGWTVVNAPTTDAAAPSEDEQVLPVLQVGDVVGCSACIRVDAKTKPPARYTEGTLMRAMENIHRAITHPEHRKMLKDGDGIGTPATRASILSELLRREFIAHHGKHLVSTALGQGIIDALPEMVKSPVLTAVYERALQAVEQTPDALSDFLSHQVQFVRDEVARVQQSRLNVSALASLHPCPRCEKPLMQRKGAKGFWWACSGYPECRETLKDHKGKPVHLTGGKKP